MFKKIFSVFITLFLCGSVFADMQKETFNRTIKYLDEGGLHFQYQKLENLDAQLRFLLDICSKANLNDPNQGMLYKKFLAALSKINFNDFQAVGSSTKRLKENLYANKFFLAVNPETAGANAAVKFNKNVKMQYCGTLPVNTVFAFGVYCDFAETFAIAEKNFKNNQDFKNNVIMFEQMFGIKAKDFAANVSGEFFSAVFNGTKKNEKHFLSVIPDNKGILKKLATRYLGPALIRYKDGSCSWEMPVAATDFGSGVTVYFAEKKVIVYNSNAPLKKLFNNDGSVQKLASAKPEIFGYLPNIEGMSYLVINLDVADFCPSAAKRNYSYCSFVSCKRGDGYLVDGRSNFNLLDVNEYAPIIEMLPELQDVLTESAAEKNNLQPMPL